MRSSRSFVEDARRAQFARVAIATIAERGIAGASLAEIADAAGVAKGLISYHFEGKGDLYREVLETLLDDSAAWLEARVPRTGPAAERLRKHVTASFAFMREHRQNLAAWLELWTAFRTQDDMEGFDAGMYARCRAGVERILRDGLKSGEFAGVEPKLGAVLVVGAIDGVMLQWLLDEKAVSLPAAERQVRSMFEAWLTAGT